MEPRHAMIHKLARCVNLMAKRKQVRSACLGQLWGCDVWRQVYAPERRLCAVEHAADCEAMQPALSLFVPRPSTAPLATGPYHPTAGPARLQVRRLPGHVWDRS